MQRWLLAPICAAFLAAPAAEAGSLTDWSVSPPSIEWDDWTATLGGTANGSLFLADGVPRQTGAGLSAVLLPRIEHELDNGWTIGARGAILVYHDRLAGDVYGDRAFEKASLFVQTPYGRFEAGQQDGAAYRMAVTGPSVNDATTLDNASTTFFRDPSTGRAVIDMFRLESAEFASANNAKFTYTSPRWWGVQLGGSYTPAVAHGGLPFVLRGETGPDHQTNLLEGAANYSGTIGAVSLNAYAGAVIGHDAARTSAHNDLIDWALGGQAQYSIDEVTLAFGGGYRQSNAYAFDVADVRKSGEARSWRLSATATQGPWIGGFEYAGGRADRADTRPALNERGFEASLGYVVNSNLQLTAGWQQLQFRRDSGTFFNGSPEATMNAGFLNLKFHV